MRKSFFEYKFDPFFNSDFYNKIGLITYKIIKYNLPFITFILIESYETIARLIKLG